MASFTDAHIEKAARALFAISSSNSLWEPLVDRAKEHWRRRARAVLEAVADDIAAEALEGAETECRVSYFNRYKAEWDVWYEGRDPEHARGYLERGRKSSPNATLSLTTRLVTPWKPVEKETPDA